MKNLNHIKECLLQIEKKIEYNGSIRDDITGPIIDLFFTKDTELVKNLSNDLKVYYLYRTKIARDIYFNDDKKVDYLWEPQTTKIIKYLGLRSTSDALIAGAYFGDSSLILAKINPKNKVHCFEPNKSQRKQLIKNKNVNNLKNIIINKEALLNKSNLLNSLTGFDSYGSINTNKKGNIKSTTIDDYVNKNNLSLGFIQLDIEGSEYKALTGGLKTIERCRPVIIFEIHSKYFNWNKGILNTKLCKLLSDRKYNMFAIRDINSSSYKIKYIELVPLEKIYLKGPPHGFNVIAFPINFKIPKVFKVVKNVSPKYLMHKDKKFYHPIY